MSTPGRAEEPPACNCRCGCYGTGRLDDDGTPGWCDSCRMNIHEGAP